MPSRGCARTQERCWSLPTLQGEDRDNPWGQDNLAASVLLPATTSPLCHQQRPAGREQSAIRVNPPAVGPPPHGTHPTTHPALLIPPRGGHGVALLLFLLLLAERPARRVSPGGADVAAGRGWRPHSPPLCPHPCSAPTWLPGTRGQGCPRGRPHIWDGVPGLDRQTDGRTERLPPLPAPCPPSARRRLLPPACDRRQWVFCT